MVALKDLMLHPLKKFIEAIHSYNKDKLNKTKHSPAAKIKLTQKQFTSIQKRCPLPGCDQPSHSINIPTSKKCLWHNLTSNIPHGASLFPKRPSGYEYRNPLTRVNTKGTNCITSEQNRFQRTHHEEKLITYLVLRTRTL